MDERVVADSAIAGDMALQRAELLGKGDLLVLGQILIAKGEHMVPHESIIDRLARRRVERQPQIEPDPLRPGHIR